MSPTIFLRVPEAAAAIGLPTSFVRKTFIRADRRPKNVPPPPPHRKVGRSVYIIAAELPGWAAAIGTPSVTEAPTPRRGRPAKAEVIARRQQRGEG
jgi:hypothetical protein